MEQEHVTTSEVAAQVSCAQIHIDSDSGPGTIQAQPEFPPIRRRDLMAAVNTVGRDLHLRAASIVVLDALLSCLPCKTTEAGLENAITPTTLLTVFASNDTLCFRAKGITDRQLRRHLERLEEAGLIQRRDSANGKRFPIYRSGKLAGAFGIDLSPLLLRAQGLVELAQTRRAEAAELRGLKAHIQTLRTQCKEADLDEPLRAFVEGTRNLMRRAGATIGQARAIIAELTRILKQAQPTVVAKGETPESASKPANITESALPSPSSDSCEMTGTDGQNVRHKEPEENSYTKKIPLDNSPDIWTQLTTVPDFYPQPPNSEHGFRQIVYDFGKMLGLCHNLLARTVTTIGSLETLRLQDRMATRIASIADPDRYLAKVLHSLSQRRVGHGQLSSFT